MSLTDSDLVKLDSASTRTRWHLKKELQLGHIITTCTVLFSVIWYAGKLDQRIALVEQAVSAQRERDDRQDKQTVDSTTLMRVQLDKIEAKLDRVIEARKP